MSNDFRAAKMPFLLVQILLICLGTGCMTGKIQYPLEKHPQFRTWRYATGYQFDAALETARVGTAQFIMLDGQRVGVDLDRLHPGDRKYMEEILSKPRGYINDVLCLALTGAGPSFSVNATFFANGKLTETPFVYMQYIFEDKSGRIHHRACAPVNLYKTQGLFDHSKLPSTVALQCEGPVDSKRRPETMLAFRCVLLLPLAHHDFEILDVYSNQNNETLKKHGISVQWWKTPPEDAER